MIVDLMHLFLHNGKVACAASTQTSALADTRKETHMKIDAMKKSISLRGKISIRC